MRFTGGVTHPACSDAPHYIIFLWTKLVWICALAKVLDRSLGKHCTISQYLASIFRALQTNTAQAVPASPAASHPILPESHSGFLHSPPPSRSRPGSPIQAIAAFLSNCPVSSNLSPRFRYNQSTWPGGNRSSQGVPPLCREYSTTLTSNYCPPSKRR